MILLEQTVEPIETSKYAKMQRNKGINSGKMLAKPFVKAVITQTTSMNNEKRVKR